jgi:hypothetical protein
MCLGVHSPICVSVRCDNAAAFPSGELRSFSGFSAPTDRDGLGLLLR